MTGERKIKNVSEATAVRERAYHTLAATIPLLKLLKDPSLSERERADSEDKVDRLRKQYKRETEPVEEFYKGLERNSEMFERILESKDPDIVRMREEIACVLERKEGDEYAEIQRIRGEFKRMAEE